VATTHITTPSKPSGTSPEPAIPSVTTSSSGIRKWVIRDVFAALRVNLS
jgi:hypothetical protein